MNIRRAGIQDIPLIAELWEEIDIFNRYTLHLEKVFREGRVGGKKRYIKLLNKMIAQADNFIVIAEEGPNIIGFVTYFIIDQFGNGEQDAVIDVTLVSEKHRGKGVGKLLYKFLEQELKNKGVVGITTEVYDNNEDSIKFHEKQGCIPIATAIEMYKKL